MKIITFSGVDGSGKSTQLELFRKELESTGKKTSYFHAVTWSLPQAAKGLFARRSNKPGQAKAVTKSTGLGVILRQIILIIDILRFKRYLRRLERSGTDYLLSDRYFYDSLVNIAYLDGTPLDTVYARFAARLIPKPDQAILLSATPEAIMRRARAPEQGFQYLKDKTSLFLEAAGLWNFTIIDADSAPEGVFTSIKKSLSSKLSAQSSLL